MDCCNRPRAARGFRTSEYFIPIAYLRMSKLKDLPLNPFHYTQVIFSFRINDLGRVFSPSGRFHPESVRSQRLGAVSVVLATGF